MVDGGDDRDSFSNGVYWLDIVLPEPYPCFDGNVCGDRFFYPARSSQTRACFSESYYRISPGGFLCAACAGTAVVAECTGVGMV